MFHGWSSIPTPPSGDSPSGLSLNSTSHAVPPQPPVRTPPSGGTGVRGLAALAAANAQGLVGSHNGPSPPRLGYLYSAPLVHRAGEFGM